VRVGLEPPPLALLPPCPPSPSDFRLHPPPADALQGVMVSTGTMGIPTFRRGFSYDDPGDVGGEPGTQGSRGHGGRLPDGDDVGPDDSVSVRSAARGPGSVVSGTSMASSAAVARLHALQRQLEEERARAGLLEAQLREFRAGPGAGAGMGAAPGSRGGGGGSRAVSRRPPSRLGSARPGQQGAGSRIE